MFSGGNPRALIDVHSATSYIESRYKPPFSSSPTLPFRSPTTTTHHGEISMSTTSPGSSPASPASSSSSWSESTESATNKNQRKKKKAKDAKKPPRGVKSKSAGDMSKSAKDAKKTPDKGKGKPVIEKRFTNARVSNFANQLPREDLEALITKAYDNADEFRGEFAKVVRSKILPPRVIKKEARPAPNEALGTLGKLPAEGMYTLPPIS